MGSIKQEMINGVFWSAVQKYSGIVVQLVISAILARLITPAEFGVVALASVMIAFISIFADMGLGAAIVQKQELTDEDYDQIFSFSVYLGLLLCIILYISSFFIAKFYGNADLVPICQLMAIPLFFNTANMVPNALLCKDRRFKFFAVRALAFQIISGIISVVAAIMGMGCYSLLISPIITSIAGLYVGYIQYPRKFHPIFSIKPIKRIFSYSFFLLSFNIFNYFTRNLDKLIIGKYFSMNDLGYYDKSYRLMMMPLQQVTHVITPVMHPVFATLQNDKSSMGVNYAKIIKLLSNIGFPLCVFLYFSADNLIYIMYGGQWVKSVPVFEILCFSVPIQMVMSSTGSIFQAAGRTDYLFYAGSFHSVITIIGFFLAAHIYGSIEALAWSFVITMSIQFFIAFFVIYVVVLEMSFYIVLRQLYVPLLNACLIAIALYIVDIFIYNNFISLFLQSILSLVVSVAVVHLTKEYDIVRVLKSSHNKFL